MAKAEVVRPIDRAIAATETMLKMFRLAKQGNYPPAIHGQMMQGMISHAQIKYHIDAESAAQGAAWARANRQDQAVPATGKVTVPAPDQSCTPEEGDAIAEAMGECVPNPCDTTREAISQAVGFGKIPVEAA